MVHIVSTVTLSRGIDLVPAGTLVSEPDNISTPSQPIIPFEFEVSLIEHPMTSSWIWLIDDGRDRPPSEHEECSRGP